MESLSLSHLDDQAAPPVPEVHPELAEPKPPALEPVVPGGGLVAPLGLQPAGDAEHLVVAALLLGHLEDAVAHPPPAADPERRGIAARVELYFLEQTGPAEVSVFLLLALRR